MSTYFFTADLHLSHSNIIKYCHRPFANVDEMDETLIANWNATVSAHDTVFHIGDFCMGDFRKHIDRLNGIKIFLKGSHDRGLEKAGIAKHDIYMLSARQTGVVDIVMCHYAMRVWSKSHYNTWHLYGHSHGHLAPEGKSWDVGVDSNGFRPLSLAEIEVIMSKRPDNFNLVREKSQ